MVLASRALACSWDYPVWPKSKKSDTPLFRFVVEERYGAGYIDRQGRVVIPPQYSAFMNQGGDFFDGLAHVTTSDHRYFYIDATGKRVLRSVLFGAEFSEGLTITWSGSKKKSGYMDRNGNQVIAEKFDGGRNFSEGLALVILDGKHGYIDHSGNLAIPAGFPWASDFADGHALVIENGPCQRVGYGPCEMAPYSVPERFGFDLRVPAPSTERCKYSVIDRTGKVVFASNFVDAKDFSEGLAPMGDGKKWGYVDESGKVRIPLQFDSADPFSEGLAHVRMNGKSGYIDKSGKIVIPPKFSYGEGFSEGLAVVRYESIFLFIDTKGQRAIAGDFDGASSFVMGLAHIRVGRDYYAAKWSYIDKSGKAIFTYSDHSKRR
jgi:hypothetical protein